MVELNLKHINKKYPNNNTYSVRILISKLKIVNSLSSSALPVAENPLR